MLAALTAALVLQSAEAGPGLRELQFEARALRDAGELYEAEAAFRSLIDRLASQRPDARLDTAFALSELALVLDELGRHAEAETLMLEAIAVQERQLGADHSDVATSLNRLGLILRRAGFAEQAIGLHRRALAIDEADAHLDDYDRVTTLTYLGLALLASGRGGAAVDVLSRALEIEQARTSAQDPDLATALNALGRAYLTAGDPDRAAALHGQALEIDRAARRSSLDAAMSGYLLALAQTVLGALDAAEAGLQTSYELRMQALGARHGQTRLAACALGRIRLDNDPAGALAAARGGMKAGAGFMVAEAPGGCAETLAEAAWRVAQDRR